jgi:predicted RNA-binding protein with RPS1 domain
VGSIHRGEVKRIEAYGVFVALPGFRKFGLVHASQVRAAWQRAAVAGWAVQRAHVCSTV